MSEPYRDLGINIRTLLPSNKGAAILDFGCGSGRLIGYLVENGYENITGVDRQISGCDSASTAGARLLQIESAQTYLASQKACFDPIFVKDVLYYFDAEEIVPIARQLREALKPGGTAVFEIFNGSVLTGPYVKYKDLGIKLILTEHSLQNVLEEAGWTVQRMHGNKPVLRSSMSYLFAAAGVLWRGLLRLVYLVERGVDSENPRILTKKVIAVATNEQQT